MALARILSPNLFSCYVSINLPTASWGIPRTVGKIGFGNLVTLQSVGYWCILAKVLFVMCGSPQRPLLMHFSKRTHFYRMLYTYIQSAFASGYYHALQQHRFQQAICLAPIHEIPTQPASIIFRLSNTGAHQGTWYKISPGAFCLSSSTTNNLGIFSERWH